MTHVPHSSLQSPTAALNRGVQVTTKALAGAFSNGMEYFNTYGGCTAAGAAGLATLDVICRENLMQNAADVGGRLMQHLRQLQKVRMCSGF